MEKIAVIILTKNNFKLLKSCLNSFKTNNTYKSLKFYIGDTGSRQSIIEQTEDYIKNFDFDVEIIKFKKYCFSKNNNWIVRNRVQEKLILFCNDDIKIENDCIPDMVNLLNEKVGTVGCKLLYPDDTIQHLGHIHCAVSSNNHNTTIGVHHYYHKFPNKKFENPLLVHGNTFAFCLINTDTFITAGYLNEKYDTCFEDVDFCHRCTKLNLKHLCIGDKYNYHIESASRGSNGNCYMTNADRKMIVETLTEFYRNNTENNDFKTLSSNISSFIPTLSAINYGDLL